MILRDDQWEALAPLLLGKRGDPGVCGGNNRLFIEALLWRISTQQQWYRLPVEFGNWNAIYMRFRRWSQCGFWHQLLDNLGNDPELRGLIQKIAMQADQQVLKAMQKAARKSKLKIYQASIQQILASGGC